ncbi:hypothetical protein [Gimesia panareensis]|uniref:hypothetical protein n=1 Tax=Gimesia panareensis TaxID=2527978 RepID=UPI00118B838E|nr:hypothetical protein [Gimesia panareensis]QDU51682.1 hypothetical protein Pan110_40490 [Gimesia panareensis]
MTDLASPAKTTTSPAELSLFARWVSGIILAGLLILFLFWFPATREDYFRCAICGMSHTEQSVAWFGWPLSTSEHPTECSDWYQSHVEPEHQHVWASNCFAREKNCFGQTVLMQQLGSLATGPISWLHLGDYKTIQIYQKSPDPAQARALLLKLARFAPAGSPEKQTQDEIFARFWDWKLNGMQGPWPFKESEFLTPAQ